MEDSAYTVRTLSWDLEDMITLLKRMLDEGIQLAVAEQMTSLEKIFT